MIVAGIVFKYKHCYLCMRKRLLWKKSEKPYVIKVTGGTNYCCLLCTIKNKEKWKIQKTK